MESGWSGIATPPRLQRGGVGGWFCVLVSVSLDILAGKLPKKVYNLIVEWALEHKDELKNDWDLLSDDKEPKKIEPLT